MAVFYASLYRVSGEQRYADLARSALADVLCLVEERDNLRRWTLQSGPGILSGSGSIAYATTLVSSMLEDTDLMIVAEEIIDFCPQKWPASCDLDISGGLSGTILAILAFNSLSPGGNALQKAIDYARGLLNDHEKIEVARQSLGMAHGLSGVGLALMRLFGATGINCFLKNSALAMFAKEREVHIADERDLCQWCHGSAGYGLSRIASLEVVDVDDFKSDIDRALTRVLSFSGTEDHSACCGVFGRLELIKSAEELLGGRSGRSEELLESTLRRIRASGQMAVSSGRDPYAVGFFTGLSGVGFESFGFRALPNYLVHLRLTFLHDLILFIRRLL